MREITKYNLIKTLGNYTNKMSRVKTSEELAMVFSQITDELIPDEYTGLYLFDHGANKLRLLSSRGLTDEEKCIAEESAMERMPGKIFREKNWLYIPDADNFSGKVFFDSQVSLQFKSILYLPVMNRDECIGTLAVAGCSQDQFNEEIIEVLRFLCQLTGVAYSNIVYENEREKVLKDLLSKERAIQASRNGITISDATKPYNPLIYLNPGFTEITGYTADELLGKNCRILQGEDRNQPGLQEIRTAIEQAKACTVVLRNYRKDGTLFWNELNLSPVFNSEGTLTNYIGILSDITERVISDQRLNESNTRLAELIKNINAAILVEDENRKIVVVNDKFCKMFGIPADPEDLVGADCSESAHQTKHLFADPLKFLIGIEKVLYERKLIINEELTLASGRILERDYIPIFLNESYKGHLWNYRDITERKKTEEVLRDNESYARSLLAVIPDLFFVLSKEGIFLDYKAAENELYTLPEMFLNKNYKDVLPPELSEIIYNALINLNEKDKTVDINYSLHFPEGENYFSGKGIQFGNDKVIFFIRNITSQRNSEVRLQVQNQLQSILMMISSKYINIPLTNIDKVIHESLETIAKFVGADRSYIFSYNFDKNTTSNTFEWCESDIAPQIDELQDVPTEALADWVETHKAGRQMLVPDVLALPDDSGLRQILEPQGIKTLIALPMMSEKTCIGFVGFDWVKGHHKISDTENNLLAVFAQLLVNINNRIESETQLKIEKHNVETSNKALSEFAYIASHDLREPLRKISAFGSLLSKSLSGKLIEDDQENLDFMIDGAKRMQQMIDDLLYYSRITSKADTYSIIDLDNLLDEIISFDLSEMIKDAKAKILIENKLGVIKGERTQIKQVFQNLIGNGIKYRKTATEPFIKIKSFRHAGYMEYRVEDNGIGIDEKYRDQIFEMFKRLHSKGEYEGNGIGLAVCKKIIELYEGEIHVESKFGEGSSFIFRIPVADNE